MLTVIALIIVLGVLVFVHEAGHFIAAKWAGIYVHRFSLGLGSPIPWLTTKRGETEYSISWLPLGGYVKMASREEEATSAALEGGASDVVVPPDRVFEAKPVWKRMIVILAGVTMNFLFAWAVYAFLTAKLGRAIDLTTTVGRVDTTLAAGPSAALRNLRPGDRITALDGKPAESWNDIQSRITNAPGNEVTLAVADGRSITLPIPASAVEERAKASIALLPWRGTVVDSIVPGTPAAKAGIQLGDTLLALNGTPVSQYYDVVSVLDTLPGKPVTVTVGRAGGRRDVALVAESATDAGADGKPRRVGRMGVAFRGNVKREPVGVVAAIGDGFKETVHQATFIVRTVRGLLTRHVASTSLGGPILIAQQAGQAAKLGLDVFLGFMALISVNLAVLNLLPVPVLDGGQLVFLIAEAVLRRPLSLRLRERLTAVGLALVLLLMVFAFSNDIRRVLGLL
jgi:regulator of sigma E protease